MSETEKLQSVFQNLSSESSLGERSYWCCLFTRDGAETLAITLSSIVHQSIPPSFIIVIDDGSTDRTPQILREIRYTFPILFIIKTDSKTRDLRRAPRLLNLGLAESERKPETSFMMISGDDADFPADYSEKIMSRMITEGGVAVASGDWGMTTTMGLERQPHGGGRFVRSDFMKKIGNEYPVGYGWETWLIFKAMESGYKTRNYPDIKYRHLRPFRPTNVYGWGRAMYSLGYPFYFVFLRFIRNLLVRKGQMMTPRADFSMLAGYFASLLNPGEIRGLVIQDRLLKRFVKRTCTSRLVELLI